MVLFGKTGMLAGQLLEHHGMLEIYVHIYAGMMLFLVSIACIMILYSTKRTKIFSTMMWGILYIGFIGLGESVEHFFEEAFVHNFFHYLHMISAPLGILFFYLGIKEFINAESERYKSLSKDIDMGIFGIMLVVIILMASWSETPWDVKIEGPFLYLTSLSTLALVWLLLLENRKRSEPLMSLHIWVIPTLLSLLTFDILAGRFVDIYKSASGYIMTHSILDILLVALSTALLPFSLSFAQIYKLKNFTEVEAEPTPEPKKFRLDEQ